MPGSSIEMFTGIIESVGKIKARKKKGASLSMAIETQFKKISVGESVAVDGVCLTVTEKKTMKSGGIFSADLSPETRQKTTLDLIAVGAEVNLERSLQMNDRFGGHFVQGHVDGTGRIQRIAAEGNSKLYFFSYPPNLRPFLIEKGSVAVNGISLTIVHCLDECFSVAIIPFTEENTALRSREKGDAVNIECDILAKMVAAQTQNLLKTNLAAELYQVRKMKLEIGGEDLG